MGLFTTVRRLGLSSLGGILTCLMLLPLPVLAYTIGAWTPVDNGVNLTNNSSGNTPPNTVLTFSSSSPNAGSPSATATSTVTGSSPSDTLSAKLYLNGLSLTTGSLTVTVSVIYMGVTQGTLSATITGTPVAPIQLTTISNGTELTLNGQPETLSVSFSFSGSVFSYIPTTTSNLVFGN